MEENISNLIETSGEQYIAEEVPNTSCEFCSSLNGPFPDELRGLNWGGFLMPLWWGIANGSLLGWLVAVIIISSNAILSILPNIYASIPGLSSIFLILGVELFAIGLVFLFKGNKIAWQNRKFESISQFKKVQKKWLIAGLIINILHIPFVIADII